MTDLDLLAATAAGDRSAFRTFLRRHQAGVYRYLTLLGASASEAEDAMQETFLSAFRAAETFRGGSGRSWLLTIARRQLFRGRRPTRHEAPASLLDLGCAAGWGQPPTGADGIDDVERREQLVLSLQQLAPEDREVLLARDVEGLSGKETAALLDLELPAMKSRLHRARLRLAAALRQSEQIPEVRHDG